MFGVTLRDLVRMKIGPDHPFAGAGFFDFGDHGGLPCTAQEQIDAIKAINSPSLRATIDVGNYMSGGEEGHVATAKLLRSRVIGLIVTRLADHETKLAAKLAGK